jgi:hypothetical protein
MAERGLSVDHTTIWRWTQAYAAEVQLRLCGQLKPKGSTWHIDETFVRIASCWMYLFRAVHSSGQRVDSTYLKLGIGRPQSVSSSELWLIRTTAYHMSSQETDCAVTQQPFENCSKKVNSARGVGIEPNYTRITALNPTTVLSKDVCARCKVREPRRPRGG